MPYAGRTVIRSRNGNVPDETVRGLARDAFDHAQAGRRDFVGVSLALDDTEILARVLGQELVDRGHARLDELVAASFGDEGTFTFEVGPILYLWVPAPLASVSPKIEDVLRAFAEETHDTDHGPRRLTASAGFSSSASADPSLDPRLCFEILEAVAVEGLKVAADGGGGRAVHSELYGFLQRGLERRRPEVLKEQARRVGALAAQQSQTELEPAPAPASKPASKPGTGLVPRPAREPVPQPDPTPTQLSPRVQSRPTPAPRSELGAVVHELLSGLRAGNADLSLVERSLEAIIAERVEKERKTAAAVAQQRYGLQVDRLERRLAKLNQALADSEARLVASEAAPIEENGEASAYRTVQGISPGDMQFERKRKLMSQLFAANLELQGGYI